MSDEADTIKCTNCKLEILSSNYTIHSVHCQRNFYLCSQCEQPVNYKNKIEHEKANHVIIHCTNCQLALEKYLLDGHLINDCPDRKVRCQICDIEVKANDILEHENYCGSRTEKCVECGEFVMLKYKSLHIDSNHGFIKLSDEPGPSPSWQYGKRTLCNFMPDLSSKSPKPVPVRKRKSSENSRRSRNSGSNDSKDDLEDIYSKNFEASSPEKNDQIRSKIWNDVKEDNNVKKTTTTDVDEWPPLSSLKSLQISDDEDDDIPRSSNSRQNEIDEESDLMYAIKLSQEINSGIWQKGIRREDKSLLNSFKPLVENDLSTEKLVEKKMFEKNPKKVNEKPKNDVLENNYNFLYDKHESVELPCEFCGDWIISNNLILHQRRCRLYMTESFNKKTVKPTKFYFNEDFEKKIACGMCNKFFKMSLLENHQLHCQRNPIKSFKNQDKMNSSKNLKTMNMKSEQGLQNGLEPSSPQLTRMGTRSEWLSEFSKNNEGGRDMQNNLNRPESGVVTKATKVSRKNRRAPSPPKM